MCPNRREVLQLLTATVSGAGVALAGCASTDDAGPVSSGEAANDSNGGGSERGSTDRDEAVEPERSSFALADGDEQETAVYVIETDREGPTAAVVGGMHGNEPSGAEAARNVRSWTPDRGTLVALPEANKPALEEGRRNWPKGYDLNREFPSGREPTSPLAREMWEEIVVGYDLDLLIDVHSSNGVLERGDGVGQNVFHSTHERMRSAVEAVTTTLTDRYVDGEYDDVYEFVTTPMDGEMRTLTIKADNDRDVPSCLFETTKDGVELEERIEWSTAFAADMLTGWGLFDEAPA